MKLHREKLLAIVLLLFVIALAACSNSLDETANQDNESLHVQPKQESNEDITESTEPATKTEDTSIEEPVVQQDEPSNKENQSNGVAEKEENAPTNTTYLSNEYLEKLNEMEEKDRYSEVGTTIVELEEQEEERYNKWDAELNTIYGILEEQLSTEEMDRLREEQRDWITYRDEEAKVSSLQYEGGSTESLEYIATQATLTRERCYVLVAKYMD